MQLYSLNWLDYVIMGLIAISAIISLIRGFVREALSLASWIFAFWVALKFFHDTADLLAPHITNATVRNIIAFSSLFIITLILAALMSAMLANFFERIGLGGTDRFLGVIFGFGRGILLIALLLLLAKMTPLPREQIWHDAQLISIFQPLETWLIGFLPQELDYDLQYQQALPNPAPSPPKQSASLGQKTRN